MIVYSGPSLIDGGPIEATITANSRNEKTGDMIQSTIMRSDVKPHTAQRTGADRSVCGDCPQRPSLGGACYVTTCQAPLSSFKASRRKAGAYNQARRAIAALERGTPVRLGSYGDPAAVPLQVWIDLLAWSGSPRWTGYTHQWRDCDPEFRHYVMASCETLADANLARSQGWRVFLVIAPDAPIPAGFIECLSDSHGKTCAECGLCNGARRNVDKQPASIAIHIHGSKARRSTMLSVLK